MSYYLMPESFDDVEGIHGPFEDITFALKVMKQVIERDGKGYIILEKIGEGDAIYTADIRLNEKEPVEPTGLGEAYKDILKAFTEEGIYITAKVEDILRNALQGEEKLWYPDDGNWIEHKAGDKAPDLKGKYCYILTEKSRERKVWEQKDIPCTVSTWDWDKLPKWPGCEIVAYKVKED